MESKKEIQLRKIEGIVVSDKMDKTVVVSVTTVKTHPIYKKQYKVSKKYKAHDEKNEYKIGDEVIIAATKPISKDKSWLVVGRKEKK
jgi:small subunit ribosomal protein S17